MFFNSIIFALHKSFLFSQQVNFLDHTAPQRIFTANNLGGNICHVVKWLPYMQKKFKVLHIFFRKHFQGSYGTVIRKNSLIQIFVSLGIPIVKQYSQIFIPDDIAKYNSRYMVFLWLKNVLCITIFKKLHWPGKRSLEANASMSVSTWSKVIIQPISVVNLAIM